MARTPLMTFLRRMVGDHVEANRRGIPVGEARAERAVRRRDVLKGMGAAAGAAVASRAGLAHAGHAPRIAIVGGGIAGLNAALTLDDAGYGSTIYESDDHFGGRIASDTTTWANGQVTEWCGELIDTGHTTMQALAARFGLTLDDLKAAEPVGSTETYYFKGHYYPYADADADFQHLIEVLTDQNTNAGYPTVYNSYTKAGWALDHLSLYAWIDKYVPGGHHSKLGMLLDVAYDIEYGRATTEQSSLNLVYLLPGPTNDLVVFGYSDEHYHVRGGNDQIPKAIAAYLPAGTIKLSHALTKIVKNHDGSSTLTFKTPSGNQTVTADRVILTLPFSCLRFVDTSQAGFDTLKNIAIQELGYGTNAKLQLQFTERYWNRAGKPWGNSNGTSYADTGYQNTWDVTRAQPGATGIMVDYTGSAGALFQPDMGDDSYSATSPAVRKYAAEFLEQIEPVFPGLGARYTGTATLHCPTDDPNLRGSYSCWLVGQYTLFSGYEGARQGKIHFAGEHCSTSFQGYMEGGAEEGARAAGEILTDYQNGITP